MSDPLAELSSLAERVEQRRKNDALATERAIQLRAVEPLLEVLGWDVRGSDVVPDATIGDAHVDYCLTIDSSPAIVVVTVAPEGSLSEAVAGLDAFVRSGPARRGIVASDTSIVLLATGDTEVHRHTVPFDDLPTHADALGQYHRSVQERANRAHSSDNAGPATALAEHRAAVVEDLTATIVDVTGPAVDGVVAAEVEAFVDSLEAVLETGDRSTSPTPGEAESAGSDDRDDPAATVPRQTRPRESVDRDDPDADGQSIDGVSADSTADSNSQQATDDDTEYVVRFFGGASSVGAVGTDSPRGTTLGTVRYLLENHDLLGSMTLPWRDEAGTTALSSSREGPDWIELANDAGDVVFVRPIDDPTEGRACIEALAETVGLRVMFQGDW